MTTPEMRVLKAAEYTIGWLCALPCELAASTAMLDEQHGDLYNMPNDDNPYVLGSIGPHNIVIACLPFGVYGTASATAVATQLRSSFPSVRLGLMVGIGGGAPGEDADIRLGDIVISQPTESFGGVVQYDYGKTIQGGNFKRIGLLNKPPFALLRGLSILESKRMLGRSKVSNYLADITKRYPTMEYPGQSHDQLYASNYDHQSLETSCRKCKKGKLVSRPLRAETSPVIHHGTIASGNQIMRHGATRDRLRKELGILCFETEAAGLMDSYPCLVIRGICDYADSHKNKLWQPYAAAAAAAYAKELVLAIPPQQVLSGPTIAEVTMATDADFKVPFTLTGCPRISKFVGRGDYIQSIERFLLPLADKGEPKILVLHGVGGIGKTQLAAQFAKSRKDQFSAVFWINGKTESTLRAGLAGLVDRIPSVAGLHKDERSGDEKSIEMMITVVTRWLGLSGNFRWLVIFDGVDNQTQYVDDPELAPPSSLAYDIRKYIRLFNQGSIVITSRLSYMSQLGDDMKIREITPDEGLQLLKSINPCIDDLGAVKLARRLDGLPLGLSHAACYMVQRGISSHQYLQKYNQELSGRKKLLEHVPRLSPYNISLMTSWEISLAAIQEESPLAVVFLTLCSFLHNADLYFELFQNFVARCENWLRNVAGDQDSFQGQIEILLNFSFLQPNHGTDPVSYSIHPVVQDWGRDRLQQLVWLDNLRQCISIIGAAVPSQKSKEAWETRRRLIPHADRCRELLDKYPNSESETFVSLDQLGRLYFDYHRLDDAERMVVWALRIYKVELGLSNSTTLGAMNLLGMLYHSQGKLPEAEELLQAALKGYKENKAWDDPGFLAIYTNLAIIYTNQGDFARAKSMLLTAMEFLELSTNACQDTLSCVLLNLSVILKEQGHLADAENLLELALERFQRAFGPHSISVFNCINNLGNIYMDQGRLLDAEEAFQKALSGFSEILGPDHVTTILVSDSLQELKVPMTEEIREERVASVRRVLKKQEEGGGQKSMAALGSMVNLGMALSENGEFEEANTILQQAHQSLVETVGPAHRHTILATSALGCLYGKQKKFAEARSYLEQALARSETVHGKEDLRTLHILCNVADLSHDEGKFKEAEAIFLKVIRLYEKKLGADNVSTLEAVQRLGRLYLNNARLEEAEPYTKKAFEGFRTLLGANNTHTIHASQELELLRNLRQQQAPAEVTYHAICGWPDSRFIFPFTFVEQAPGLLCDPSQAQCPGYNDVLRAFMASTISRHNNEILSKRRWVCETCGQTARELFHSAVPFLIPNEHSPPSFKPMLVDTVIPICRSAGECDRQAEEMANRSAKDIFPNSASDTPSRTCNSCLRQSNIKLCAGCMTIGYCSKGCQIQDWPSHKKNCKMTR